MELDTRPFSQEDLLNIVTLRNGVHYLREIDRTPPNETVIFQRGKRKMRGDRQTRAIIFGAVAGVVVQLNARGLGDIVREELSNGER